MGGVQVVVPDVQEFRSVCSRGLPVSHVLDVSKVGSLARTLRAFLVACVLVEV